MSNISYVEMMTVSCMRKFYYESELIQREARGVTLKNQKHRFQLIIKNTQGALYHNRIAVTGDLAPFVSLSIIDSVPAECTYITPTDDYYLGGSGIYPDVIRPFHDGDLIIPPGGNKCLWVCVTPKDTLPVGIYKIGFQLFNSDGDLTAETEYELEVLDIELESSDIKKTNWMHYDCICHMHNVKPFTSAFYKAFENYLAAYTRSGFNMLLTPLFTPPLDTYIGGERMTIQLIDVYVENNGYTFEFKKLKKFLNFVFARGIKYIEFSHLFTQWGGACCPKIIAKENGEEKKIFGWENDSCSEEYKRFLNEFLSELIKFIKKEGIEDRCYFHVTDEPGEEHLERYKECRQIVKNNIGDLPTLDAISHYEYYQQGLVDIPVAVLSSIDEFIKHDTKNMLAYYCCMPADNYYTNRFLNMPLQRTRILGCQLYQTNVNGFLHWGFNFYNSARSYFVINPYSVTNAGGAFPPGDGFIVYPSKDGVNLSMRSEIVAMGFEDYDLLRALEGKFGRAYVEKMLKEEGVVGYTQYPKDCEWHTKFIEKVKRLLV